MCVEHLQCGKRRGRRRVHVSAERPERVLHDAQPRHGLVDLVERAVRACLDAAREQAAHRAHVVVLGLDERVRERDHRRPRGDRRRAQERVVRVAARAGPRYGEGDGGGGGGGVAVGGADGGCDGGHEGVVEVVLELRESGAF